MTKREEMKRRLISWACDCEADPDDYEAMTWLFDRMSELEDALEIISYMGPDEAESEARFVAKRTLEGLDD